MSSIKVSDFNFEEEVESTLRKIPKKFYKTKTCQISVPDDDDAIKAVRDALKPWEEGSEVTITGEKKVEDVIAWLEQFASKDCSATAPFISEDLVLRLKYDIYGFDSIKDLKVSDVSKELYEAIQKNAMASVEKNEVSPEVRWLFGL
jgi:hypothetical protein